MMSLLPLSEFGPHVGDQGLVLGVELVLQGRDLLADTLLDLLSPVQPREVTLGDARGSVALDQVELIGDFTRMIALTTS